MKISDTIKLWLRIGRDYTLSQSVVPYIFAVIFAAKQCKINYLLSLLGLIGVVLVQASMNMLDDYFDWKKGAVEKYKKLLDAGMQARTHKCFYLEQGLTTLNTVFAVALSLDAIACLLGLFIAYNVGYSVILIAVLAGFMGFSYSGPPFKFGYRGLGELVIGIIFGPLLVSGAYITAGAHIDKPIILASVMLGLIIANVAHTHAIMDFKSDVEVGKKSLATLCKTKENAIRVQLLIYLLAYTILAAGIILNIYPLATALTFITLPKAIALNRLMKKEDKTKKFWMGPIGNWEKFQEEGSDWFMMRLCLSCNLVADFAIILALTYYLFG